MYGQKINKKTAYIIGTPGKYFYSNDVCFKHVFCLLIKLENNGLFLRISCMTSMRSCPFSDSNQSVIASKSLIFWGIPVTLLLQRMILSTLSSLSVSLSIWTSKMDRLLLYFLGTNFYGKKS